MKLRNGFVSNSSSSSFILDKKYYPTIWHVVLDMLKVQVEHYKELGFEYNDVLQRIERAQLCKGIELSCSNLTFPSINYDTYIHDAGDSWWVGTCNNTPFYELLGDKIIDRYKPSGAVNHTDWSGTYDYRDDIRHYIEYCMKDDYTYEEL